MTIANAWPNGLGLTAEQQRMIDSIPITPLMLKLYCQNERVTPKTARRHWRGLPHSHYVNTLPAYQRFGAVGAIGRELFPEDARWCIEDNDLVIEMENHLADEFAVENYDIFKQRLGAANLFLPILAIDICDHLNSGQWMFTADGNFWCTR